MVHTSKVLSEFLLCASVTLWWDPTTETQRHREKHFQELRKFLEHLRSSDMKTIVLTLFSAIIAVCFLSFTEVTTGTVPPAATPAAGKKMQAFKSEQELRRYFKRLAAKHKRVTVPLPPAEVAGVAATPAPKSAAGAL